MKSIWSKPASMVLAAGAAFSSAAHAVSDLPGGPAVRQLNLPVGVTKVSEEQYFLHWALMILCTVIFVAVFSVMFYSIWKHRKSVGHKAANFHESVVVEVVWTIIPFIIVILMALPATKLLVAQKDTTNADLTIKVTGYQWKWGYDYINGEGEGLAFISTLDSSHRAMSDAGAKGEVPADYLLKVDNPLVVPEKQKIRIITTANDVIHAFAVPQFGIKQDAIPGFVRDTWFRAERTGDFYGQCQELCGKEHAYMPIHVKVVTAAEYTAWVDTKRKEAAAKLDDPNKVWTLPEILARGERVYAANCAACHQANGKGAGPIKPLDGAAVVLDTDHAKQLQVLLNGQNNGAMPAWKQLSDTDLAAVATYTKNSWSNKTGQIVQPAEAAAVRAGKALPAGAAAPAAAGGAASAAQPAASATPQPATATAASATGLPVNVFFGSGRAELDEAARRAIEVTAQYLQANPNAKVVLSGFVDASGGADLNAELAKQRALQVRDALTRAGVAENRVELLRPQQIEAGAADAAQARRVEIRAAG